MPTAATVARIRIASHFAHSDLKAVSAALTTRALRLEESSPVEHRNILSVETIGPARIRKQSVVICASRTSGIFQ